jgi:hypothetical protein
MAPKTKAELLDSIREDQRFWRSLVADVGSARFDEPGPMGEWTFADMAGHLAGWRNRTIARVEAAGRGEPAPPNPWPAELDDDDRINDWIYEQDRASAPAELVAAYDRSYDRLAAAIDALPEPMIADPAAFPWIGEPLGSVDFTGHLHEEHVPSVRAWLERSAGAPAA